MKTMLILLCVLAQTGSTLPPDINEGPPTIFLQIDPGTIVGADEEPCVCGKLKGAWKAFVQDPKTGAFEFTDMVTFSPGGRVATDIGEGKIEDHFGRTPDMDVEYPCGLSFKIIWEDGTVIRLRCVAGRWQFTVPPGGHWGYLERP